MKYIKWTLMLTSFWFVFVKAEPSVHILAENLEQFITSTTLEWIPYNDKISLRNAVVAAYQIVEEPKNNEAELSENETGEDDLTKRPVYVCRAKINSVWVSGQLRPTKNVCVVSLYGKVTDYKEFDVLISIEDSAKLSWVHKDKYTLISQGAVTNGENVLRSFVARRAANSHDKEGSLSHYIGKFTPSENLGMFYVVDQNNIEIPYEDGELLIETEPISYELKNIKFARINKHHPKKQQVLGHAILKNEENTFQRVESVINYSYDYNLFWGKGHGLLTGLPLKVNLPSGNQINGSWALHYVAPQVELVPVERFLEAGTAVNVTLLGNYTELEIPYTATIVQNYKDGEKREIIIRDTKRENKMMEIIAEYTPAYYLHNNSLVPTTTTTSTTTTTTISTTTKLTTTTQEVVPIASPESINNKQADNLQSSEKKVDEEQNSTMGETRESKSNSSNVSVTNSIITCLTVLLFLLFGHA
ncbi:protein unzipped [Diorhabda sublineata]|uniref:protein unzipped n=1 Tax=Diorhabda sublineata TaxID=1163346 RepID=UPI0024E0A4E2|nr:protein unzipped [Diorhabda sublineata]